MEGGSWAVHGLAKDKNNLLDLKHVASLVGERRGGGRGEREHVYKEVGSRLLLLLTLAFIEGLGLRFLRGCLVTRERRQGIQACRNHASKHSPLNALLGTIYH